MGSAGGPLAALRDAAIPGGPLDETPLLPGVRFRLDPEGGSAGRWTSPRDRIVELTVATGRPSRWLGLHLELPEAADLAGTAWLGFALRGAADRPIAVRPCLRSGREAEAGGGFVDLFFARHVLLRPGARDHHDMIAPPRSPDLPALAPWREFILFLPPAEPYRLVLEELAVFLL